MGTTDLTDLKRSPLEAAAWGVLILLLLLTLIGAARLDRSKLPLIGDEATYAMQASSLVHDFDLTYTRKDYDRFVAQWGVPPQGLILQSRPGSGRLTYGKPPLYALLLAPFVAVSPVRGPLVANALLLAAAALLAARALRNHIGGSAPLWVSAWIFASVAFAYVFWGESDLFLFAAVASGFALVYWGDRRYFRKGDPPPSIYQGEDTEPSRAFVLRWLGAGALLGVAFLYRPVYLVLLIPALLAAWETPAGRRGRALSGLLLGALVIAALSMGLQWIAGGDATGYGGQRQGIYTNNAYPEVSYPAARWSDQIRREGNASWLQADAVKPEFNLKLLGWNLLYSLIGRNVGILPYFLPLLLGFLAFRPERGRWAIPLAVAAAVLAFLVLRPFNFYGGGPLGNRYFLPLYPALWFMAARPVKAVWAPILALLASPFLQPLWTAPTAYPLAESGDYRLVSSFAQKWLPYETTQAGVPGQQVAVGNGLWVKLLDHNLWPAGKGDALRIAGDAPAHLLLGSPKRLKGLNVELDKNAPSHLRIGDNDLRPVLLEPNGSVVFEIAMEEPKAMHPLWWGAGDYYLYDLEMQLPGAKTVPIGVRVWAAEELIQVPWMKVK
jgi:4-amino-4-deoxy-L-arabinose transferase-like glycosyltransferase